MLTRFSKWMIYMSSYALLYSLLIIKLFGFSQMENKTLLETWGLQFEEYKVAIIILLGLFVVSIIWMRLMVHWENNTRMKSKLKKNSTIEMVGFIIPYIISMLTIDIDGFGMILNVIIFILLGLAFVFSDMIYLCPTFLMLGYKLYSDETIHVLSKQSLEAINLIMDEDVDGVHVRELCKNTYILL